jgi:hypothetical protein
MHGYARLIHRQQHPTEQSVRLTVGMSILRDIETLLSRLPPRCTPVDDVIFVAVIILTCDASTSPNTHWTHVPW